ncbi:uncharacterized protein LOC133930382 [Phragmites australis]|uniref:uncharacterized protein LOC133930382 n=1 Tax=Phragmites australis TaxID=29695 RepID=UPI002D76CE54|nr:uncharacterized protein LOC133930382 [Phragmites australis]
MWEAATLFSSWPSLLYAIPIHKTYEAISMVSKTLAVLLCVTVASLLVTQEVAADTATTQGPATAHVGGKVGQKDDISISIGGGGGHVSITGSIHVGDKGKPKHDSKETPSYGQPHP